MVLSATSHAAEGLVQIRSSFSAKETMDRFEEKVKQKDLIVFARINHSAGAEKVGKTLAPTELILFGHPKTGTPLMECAQTLGIDLPLKALVWQDAAGQVWLGYNDLHYLAKRHGVTSCPAVETLNKALAGLAALTLQP